MSGKIPLSTMTTPSGTTANSWNPNGIIKSGFLLRQSTFLKRWKRAWFVLYASGRLSFFESEHSSSAKDHLHVPAEKAEILTADKCAIEPPEGHDKAMLFGVKTKSKTWYLCAEEENDLMAWQLSLADAQSLQPTSYGQHNGWTPGTIPEGMRAVYPDQVKEAMHYGVYDPKQMPVTISADGSTIQLPPGSTLYLTQDGPIVIDAEGNRTLITQDGRFHNRGMGTGSAMLAGAAIGSMMMWPWILWMPMFWW